MKYKRAVALKFSLCIGVAVVFSFLHVSAAARADNGPHGGYTVTTDACAGCHRAHSAAAAQLLLDAVPNLCYSCHGSAGLGADTNVVDGIYLERDATVESPAEGVANHALKAGGFGNALMDTNRDGAASSAPVTSNHIVDGGADTAWANGAVGSGPGAPGFGLSCTSCHDPHGGGTYRLLRPIPNGSGAGLPIIVPDEASKAYTVSDLSNDYLVENYGSLASPLSAWCAQCHTRDQAPSGSGHADSGDPIYKFRHSTAGVACVRCHVAHGTSATMGTFSGAAPWPDASTTPNGNARSSLLRADNRAVCAYCHLKSDGTITGGACDSCHGAPPMTGAHARHAGSGAVGYGLTGSFATDDTYQFGCGECHSTDSALHQNGTVDVSLSSTGAPGGSLKIQNSPAASYAGGTCGGVYCHSGIQVTSGPVGAPLDDGSGHYILDSHGNLTYASYSVAETRMYQTTPLWAGGSIADCTACHAFPLTTAYPSVQAGVGNSHQWMDDYGYGNLHAYNMGYDPLLCRTCHYGEITQANTWTRNAADVTAYDAVPLASRAVHVNGQRDVAFDAVNPVVYGANAYSLSAAAYVPAEKACTNVACHKSQNYVQWGTPYRWWTNECDLCHRYSLPTPSPLGSPIVTGSSDVHSGLDLTQQTCVSCHTEPHRGG